MKSVLNVSVSRADFGVRIGDDIALFDNLQAHLMTTDFAVMRRGRLPLALFESLPAFAEMVVPAAEIQSDDYDQQKNVDDVDKIRYRSPIG